MKERKNNKQSRTLFGRCMNKYTVTLLIFGVWLAFLDHNSLIERYRLCSKINTLKQEKDYYQKKIEEDTRKTKELLGSRKKLEKFAREEYLMKRPNEDIFVIVND